MEAVFFVGLINLFFIPMLPLCLYYKKRPAPQVQPRATVSLWRGGDPDHPRGEVPPGPAAARPHPGRIQLLYPGGPDRRMAAAVPGIAFQKRFRQGGVQKT